MPVSTDSYMHEFLYSELADVVGPENVSTSQSDKIAYSCDFFWIPELWIDRGCRSPEPDFVVHPRSSRGGLADLPHRQQLQDPSDHLGRRIRFAGRRTADPRRASCWTRRSSTASWKSTRRRSPSPPKPASSCSTWNGRCSARASRRCTSRPRSAAPRSGGFLAHRGTGVLSTKYGKIEDMVMSLEAVLADGTIVNTLAVPRHASGPT